MLRGGKWKCYTRTYESSEKLSLKYRINHDGIYAVIFLPDIPLEEFRIEQYCGILCKDKRMVFIILFLGIPILMTVFFVFYRL